MKINMRYYEEALELFDYDLESLNRWEIQVLKANPSMCDWLNEIEDWNQTITFDSWNHYTRSNITDSLITDLNELFSYCFEVDAQYVVKLNLWLIQPRKGLSRFITISNIEQFNLVDIFKYLSDARDSNAARFRYIHTLLKW